MQGLDEGTVDFRPTYNGEDEEPEIMPGLFPNLLANGASGIAVGMATNIPPHNAAAVIRAALLLTERPDAELSDRSEEHTSELPSQMRISYAAFCLKKKQTKR